MSLVAVCGQNQVNWQFTGQGRCRPPPMRRCRCRWHSPPARCSPRWRTPVMPEAYEQGGPTVALSTTAGLCSPSYFQRSDSRHSRVLGNALVDILRV